MSLVERFCQAGTCAAIFLTGGLMLSSCSMQVNRTPVGTTETSLQADDGKSAAVLPDIELTPDILFQILVADIAIQRGENQLATAELVTAARNTRDPRLAEQATRLAVLAGDFGSAIEMANLWVEKDPENADVHQTLGNHYVVVKQVDRAVPHYRRAIELTSQPHTEMLLKNVTDTLVRYADAASALAAMQEIVTTFPDSDAVQLSYARLAGALGKTDIAVPAVEKALELNPKLEAAAVFKFNLLLLQDKADAAVDFANHYLKKHKKDIVLRSTLARYYIENDRYRKAEKEYLLVHEYEPDSQGTVMALALLRLQAGDNKKARGYLELALKQQPRNDLARIYLGEIATSENRLDEAEQWLRSVTDPDQLFSARIRLSGVVKKRDGVDAALRELEATHPETDAQQSELALIRNELLVEAERYNDAYDALSSVLEDQPDNIELLYARAMVAVQQNDVAGLERDLRHVLRLNPEHVHSMNALGYTLADKTDRIKEAEQLVSKALAEKPDDPFILDSYGWVKYRQGDLKEAEKYLQRALSLRNDPEIAAHLVEVLWKAGRKDEATGIWQKANTDFPGNKLLNAVNQNTLQR